MAKAVITIEDTGANDVNLAVEFDPPVTEDSIEQYLSHEIAIDLLDYSTLMYKPDYSTLQVTDA